MSRVDTTVNSHNSGHNSGSSGHNRPSSGHNSHGHSGHKTKVVPLSKPSSGGSRRKEQNNSKDNGHGGETPSMSLLQFQKRMLSGPSNSRSAAALIAFLVTLLEIPFLNAFQVL